MDPSTDNSEDVNSLEGPDTTLESAPSGPASPSTNNPSPSTPPATPNVPSPPSSKSFGVVLRNLLHTVLRRFNVYFILFLVIMAGAITIAIIAITRSQKEAATTNNNPLAPQNLTPDALQQLNKSNASVGDPKQTLSVESNAIFSGKVLIKSSLDVAGSINVGGTIALSNIAVSGSSTFDQVKLNSLSITGNTAVQGQLTVQKGLTVSGSGSFSGSLSASQLSVDTLQLNKDLQLNRHLDAGGSTPAKADGNALGSGGTTSINGTDTAGTVTINTGSNAPAGCFVTVTFTQKFNATPHVVITPVGSAGAALNYYLNRTSGDFSICTANAPPSAASFSFDYVAID